MGDKKRWQLRNRLWDNLCKSLYDEEDLMFPGFEDSYIDCDIKNGFKTLSIFQTSTKSDTIKEEEEKERREKEKKIIRIEHDEKTYIEIKLILEMQDDLLMVSRWIRNYKRILNSSKRENEDRYHLHLKMFWSRWKRICNKIKKIQNKTSLFKNLYNLWLIENVKIVRPRKGIRKAIFKCSRCKEWNDMAFAYPWENNEYAPPICHKCHICKIFKEMERNKRND